jgi:hypothetical protein
MRIPPKGEKWVPLVASLKRRCAKIVTPPGQKKMNDQILGYIS